MNIIYKENKKGKNFNSSSLCSFYLSCSTSSSPSFIDNLKMLMTQFSQMISAYDELNLLDVSTCKSKKIMNTGGPPIANELGAPSGFQGPRHSCPTLPAALVAAMATAAVRNIAIPPLPPTF